MPPPDSGNIRLSPRDSDKTFNVRTGSTHTFQLTAFAGRILEVEDVHFHHDSAVMMPDFGDIASIADPSDANHVSGLAVLRATYIHAQRMPSNVILVAGHTDRSGPADYNLELSNLRAKNVLHLLMGSRPDWVDICDGKHKVEDIQQILIWVTATFGWPCDPGPKTGSMNARTTAAVRSFQEKYNTEFDPDISVDGVVGPETWGAFFDVYMKGLKNLLRTDDSGMSSLRNSLKFMDSAKKTVGCGENHPITPDLVANQKSQIDRRVHILFFDPPQTPKMDCHPNDRTCNPAVCEVYGDRRIFEYEPLPANPEDVGRRFRIRLEPGDPDSMFPAISTNSSGDAGLRQRLQAVGFLYEPLNSGQIDSIAQHAWNHFKVVAGTSDDGAAVDRLREMVRDVILEGNALPATGEFAKVRFPGTYCATDADLDGGFFGNPATPAGTPHHRVQLENRVWNANAGLGIVPIVAVVEERSGETWAPARDGLQIHFQLVPPDPPPAGSPAATTLRSTAVTGSRNTETDTSTTPPRTTTRTFNMTGSPQSYVTAERARNAATAGDPQVDNAHTQVGGKRGNPVAGNDRLRNLLETATTRPGFHDTLSLAAAQASSHPNAVMATTGGGGKAAVVFMPSRTGGDRYKIRAFLDPIPEPGADQASEGTEIFAVKAETGTLVVWRILRISKYMRWDYPGAGVDPDHAMHSTRCGGALNDFDTEGFIHDEYQRAWLDVEVEDLAQTPQQITQDEWRSAIQYARARIRPTLSGRYNFNVLLPDTTATAGVHNNSPGIIRFLTAAQYDAAPKGAPPPGGWTAAAGNANFLSDMAQVMHAMMREIMDYFTHNAISGLTVIQVPTITSIEADSPTLADGSYAIMSDPSSGNWLRSGWGGMRRGCYVAFGDRVYSSAGFPYDHNSNAMHETGHTGYCPHQYTEAGQVNIGTAGSTGGVCDEHDYHDLCVMGYMSRRPGGTADFCGRCILLFAGWNTHGMPPNHPGP